MSATAWEPRRIESVTLQERVYRELARAIMSGHYTPGEVLTIRSLANSLGTSVMPVREALQRLHSDGAVALSPNRSIRIPVMTKRAFQELLDLRLLLEGMAAAAAVQAITESEIDLAEATIQVDANEARDWTLRHLLQVNYEFHFSIYRAARSAHLLPIIESLWLKMGPMYSSLERIWDTIRDKRTDVQGRHVEIIAGLRARDSERTRKAVEADVRDAEDRFREGHEFPKELEEDDAQSPA